MNTFGYPRVPGQFPTPFFGPWQARRKSQKLAVSIPGNIAETCVLCHVKKLGAMKSSWELFLSAVWSHVNKFWFPATFCSVPKNLFKNSQERFLGIFFMCPGGGIQAGTWMGLVSREDLSLKSWMSMGFENPQQIFATDDVHSRRWKIRQQVDPRKSETGKPCQRVGTLGKRIRHRMGTRVERPKKIDTANLKFTTCFFVRFSFPTLEVGFSFAPFCQAVSYCSPTTGKNFSYSSVCSVFFVCSIALFSRIHVSNLSPSIFSLTLFSVLFALPHSFFFSSTVFSLSLSLSLSLHPFLPLAPPFLASLAACFLRCGTSVCIPGANFLIFAFCLCLSFSLSLNLCFLSLAPLRTLWTQTFGRLCSRTLLHVRCDVIFSLVLLSYIFPRRPKLILFMPLLHSLRVLYLVPTLHILHDKWGADSLSVHRVVSLFLSQFVLSLFLSISCLLFLLFQIWCIFSTFSELSRFSCFLHLSSACLFSGNIMSFTSWWSTWDPLISPNSSFNFDVYCDFGPFGFLYLHWSYSPPVWHFKSLIWMTFRLISFSLGLGCLFGLVGLLCHAKIPSSPVSFGSFWHTCGHLALPLFELLTIEATIFLFSSSLITLKTEFFIFLISFGEDGFRFGKQCL